MRILHYHKRVDFTLGGVARSVADMTGVLAASGLDVTLATTALHDPAGVWAAATGPRPALATLPPLGRAQRFTPEGLARFRDLLADADSLHLHALWTPSNLQAARAALDTGIPYIVTVHGMLGRWAMSGANLKKRAFLALGGRRFLQRAAAVHFACEDERAQAAAVVRLPRAVVIPLPLDLAPFDAPPAPQRRRNAADPARVLFLSRLHPVKGVELLIDAVTQLRAEGRDIELIIAGTGDREYERALRDRAQPLGDHARFDGFVDGPAKAALYREADAFVLPSAHENFGLAWAEAMACATPTIVSRDVGPAAEIRQADAGLVTDRTAPAIQASLASLLDDPPKAHALGLRGQAWVRWFLDPPRLAAALEALYRGQTPA